MSKDDYHVLAYRILAYLYECLKEGIRPSMEYLSCDTRAFPVGESATLKTWRIFRLHPKA